MNKLPEKALQSYLQNLINKVYKILPMKEEQCATLSSYLFSLRNELIGCYRLWDVLKDKPQFLTVVSIIAVGGLVEYDEIRIPAECDGDA